MTACRLLYGNHTPDPVMERLIERARHHRMSAGERRQQKISFVYGQMMNCSPQITRADVERRLNEMEGHRD